jgi:hypothetical protein
MNINRYNCLIQNIQNLKDHLRNNRITFFEIHNKYDYNFEFTKYLKTYNLRIDIYSSQIRFFSIYSNKTKVLELDNSDSILF